jgi:hypothetical protein
MPQSWKPPRPRVASRDGAAGAGDSGDLAVCGRDGTSGRTSPRGELSVSGGRATFEGEHPLAEAFAKQADHGLGHARRAGAPLAATQVRMPALPH